ncbi:IS1182 family transposase [Salipaludibacillus agaradhaerens]|uniref:IS1182 family transposase n=1 Tax=Salipaludibacillus agaradhaerens TaxID=76935 RepID=UPI0021514BF7|nr:IS1182 family transposase [Salipaludibacillus agaradhaerens]MCR6105653.1 IS1182 family transposase [Salipaludibacillus agaradhaerens]MCR6117690.1 IS1182 family transposase [Salipaludibacillus agaradhaerens]
MFKDYNMNQVILPIDLAYKLQENDIAFAVNDLVESIPDEAFNCFYRKTGYPAYHPKMMLKIILCAYTQSVFSGRKIEALLKDSIRMMWLAQGYEPSYRTINRFRVDPDVADLLRQCFVQFRSQLVQKEMIDNDAIFIDGTKIEANANKLTFVWKKSVERYSAGLVEKSNQLYKELLEQDILPAIEQDNLDELSTEELDEIVEKLDERIEEYDNQIEASKDTKVRKQLRSERKTPKQYRKRFKDFVARKQKYRRDLAILGERNSYSKTDHDATFMRMKDDYMKNGQLKAGYNLQIATEGQYTLAYDIFPNPTDTRTFIPFLNRIEKGFFSLPSYIVADAGYGSEQNYDDILNNRQRTPLITYGMYRKEKKKAYRHYAFNLSNWPYDQESDTFTCPNGKNVTFQYWSKKKDKAGFQRTFKVYECEDCDGCPLRLQCTKAKEGKNRKVYYNEKWENQKAYIREVLSETKTGDIYGKRKVDVEPVFGFLKANLRFTRMSVRGKDKVQNEIGFALMAVNLRKYTVRQSHQSSLLHKNGPIYRMTIIRTVFYLI